MRRVSHAAVDSRRAAHLSPRRRPAPRWVRPALRIAGRSLAIGLAAAPLGWAWQSGWAERQSDALTAHAVAASARAGLVLEEVLVEGRLETTRAELLDAIGLQRGQPMLDIDPVALRARLESLPWVRAAVVERRLPGTLYLRIAEHEPLALWQRSGRLTLISREGEPIPGQKPERFAALPVVVGEDAPPHAAALLDMLAAAPDLRARVTAAVRVGGRRWNVRIDNTVDVRLPEDDPQAAWLQLAELERQHGLLERDLVVVDLRSPDRLVVRLSPDAAARRRGPSDST